MAIEIETLEAVPLNEKSEACQWANDGDELVNPVIESAEFALKETDLVKINPEGVRSAAQHVHERLISESYSPRTWRTHALHLCPPEPYDPLSPQTRATLDWVFFISALNFSFWSEKEGTDERYGVEWREGWGSEKRKVHTGYWSLVAAVDRALEDGIPITDPTFYCSEMLCPDDLIEEVFAPAPQSTETVPLIRERIQVLREVGYILCESFGGSFQGLLEQFQRRHTGEGTALQLVQMVTETFPSFRDETWLDGRRVFIWKRAQILVAETWAAFYPPSPLPSSAHPFFPKGIHQLTMFADYRVPQILHHLRILTYPSSLTHILKMHTPLQNGSREEVSIRAGSIVAVERVREEIERLVEERRKSSLAKGNSEAEKERVSSVIIDFYLWDLAKRIESGNDRIEGTETDEIVPAHRTRSIWY
ncbi:uncharacterized protein STEHIDRAFT_125253 [Stereum hirsutum FP-91666 SS1]|uniref:uncharacterized protein n=1 Tax=Stereum hirsutum (strain FP-91666) TaxID=721885 RepID=UPI000444A5F6|nr:uncharacterized protein STEHIDRAFT_125253 [Stereum hirsutum FP-91666 SS1]EIM81752.1 hypothetical protein STEHIDRAFT_125253 [Stereum hirsutum FP-91666 SS1]